MLKWINFVFFKWTELFQTELSLRGVAHLNKSVFLLVEEDFHSLNVSVNTWKNMKQNCQWISTETPFKHVKEIKSEFSYQTGWRGSEAWRSAEGE